jgi:hypothetical protein
MRYLTLFFVFAMLLGASFSLNADNIPLISESMFALGDVTSFKMYGDYALFVGGERHLQVMDFSDAEHPRLVSGCDVPDQNVVAHSISVNGQYAYLFFNRSVAIISISNPLSPQFITRMDTDYAINHSIHNDVLYTTGADLNYYLKAYSLSNPIAPQLLDSLLVNYYPSGIACSDGLLVCGNSTVEIVNTNDPTNLQISEELNFISGFEDIGSAAFAFNGSTLAVACGYFFSLYDFSQEPYLRATLSLGFQVNGNYGYIHNNRFWCRNNDGSGIVGVDFSNTDAPQVCYSEIFPGMWNSWFCMDGSLIALRTSQNVHVMKYSVLAEDNLPDFNNIYPLESISSIVSNGEWTVGINSRSYLQILGFAAGESAYPLYSIGPRSFGYMNIHNDTLLYTTLGEPYQNGLPTRYLVLFDLTSKTQKAELQLGPGYLGGEITLDGDIAYICSDNEGLFVVDISDVEQPVLLSHLQENIEYQCAVAMNGKLWIGSDYTIRCYELSQSITPEFLYEIPLYMQTPFIRPYRMLMMDNILYAISTNGYLLRIKPGLEGAEEMNIYPTRYLFNTYIAKLGDGLMVGSTDGLSVYNIQDPENLKEVAYWDARVQENKFVSLSNYAVIGDRIYVGRGKSLQVFDAGLAIAFTHGYTHETDLKLLVYPNPGKGRINIICKLPADGEAKLELYNLRGQKVFAKTYSYTKEGLNVLRMDTRDSAGRALGSGVYFARLKQGAYSQTGKLIIAK